MLSVIILIVEKWSSSQQKYLYLALNMLQTSYGQTF